MAEKGAVWREASPASAWGAVLGPVPGTVRGPVLAGELAGSSEESALRAVAATALVPRGGAGGWIPDAVRAAAGTGRSPVWAGGAGIARAAGTAASGAGGGVRTDSTARSVGGADLAGVSPREGESEAHESWMVRRTLRGPTSTSYLPSR
jgi:hypothetical protein